MSAKQRETGDNHSGPTKRNDLPIKTAKHGEEENGAPGERAPHAKSKFKQSGSCDREQGNSKTPTCGSAENSIEEEFAKPTNSKASEKETDATDTQLPGHKNDNGPFIKCFREQNTQLIYVVQADICTLKKTTIVSLSNEKDILGGVFEPIQAAAGAEMTHECKSKGMLPTERVLHVACPLRLESERDLPSCSKIIKNTIKKCLDKALNLGTAVAIPPIGTGILGFPPEEVAKHIVDVISKFCVKNKPIKPIIIVDLEESILALISTKLAEKTFIPKDCKFQAFGDEFISQQKMTCLRPKEDNVPQTEQIRIGSQIPNSDVCFKDQNGNGQASEGPRNNLESISSIQKDVCTRSINTVCIQEKEETTSVCKHAICETNIFPDANKSLVLPRKQTAAKHSPVKRTRQSIQEIGVRNVADDFCKKDNRPDVKLLPQATSVERRKKDKAAGETQESEAPMSDTSYTDKYGGDQASAKTIHPAHSTQAQVAKHAPSEKGFAQNPSIASSQKEIAIRDIEGADNNQNGAVATVPQGEISSQQKFNGEESKPTKRTRKLWKPASAWEKLLTLVADANEQCSICIDTPEKAVSLPCGHVFCKDCIITWLDSQPTCPCCGKAYGVMKGKQPDGTMTFKELPTQLAGYEDAEGTIEITYHFPNGTQSKLHPKPGQEYKGTTRKAYLPDSPEGREVLALLRKAFDARLLFTIGRSVTTGRDNTVTWNDVHHKTRMEGGPQRFGYPDPEYLSRVKEELAIKGIKTSG